MVRTSGRLKKKTDSPGKVVKMRVVKKTDKKIVEERKTVSDYPEGTLAHAKGGAQLWEHGISTVGKTSRWGKKRLFELQKLCNIA